MSTASESADHDWHGPSAFMAGGVLPRPRAWLRARPRLQGYVLAPLGLTRRLPHAVGGVYFLLYHGVPDNHANGLRKQLTAMQARGDFLTWEQGLSALASDVPLSGPRFCLSFDDGHKEWTSTVLPLLAELKVPATFFITTNKVVTGESQEQITWRDCTCLLEAGMHIGSHTITHARLALLSAGAARREVLDSKDELEGRLGVPVLDFSAPFGLPDVDYTDRDLQVVMEAGYRSCASALPGRMSPGDSPFAVRRNGLSPAWPLMAVRKRVHE
ncbi:MAG: polysaccharide deacetylase [Frankiales bacterium]|nr:polysaccharide deacetylase [Frankiales bacterium]